MRKIVICVYMICIMMVTSGCKIKTEYEFINEETRVSAIEIVLVGEGRPYTPNEQEVLTTINDINEFLSEFKELNCYKHIGDPLGIWPDTIAIKVIYDNGEYELIAAMGQATYTLEEQYRNFNAGKYFEHEQFDQFLSNYLQETVK